jgi:hypothetical protein
MLRMLPSLLRIVLSLKCLGINNVKDVKPFPRIYHLRACEQPPRSYQRRRVILILDLSCSRLGGLFALAAIRAVAHLNNVKPDWFVMKNIQLTSLQPALKLLLFVWLATVIGILVSPSDEIQLIPYETGLVILFSVALAVLAWTIFHLIQPIRHGRKWEIAEYFAVPVVCGAGKSGIITTKRAGPEQISNFI